MKHTKAISRRPAKAQSAYASKLFFKQELSSMVTQNSAVIFGSLFFNSLSLGTFFEVIFPDDEEEA
ncbi:MAG: hypothetical protein SGI88_05485 [Candidatus Hydrogenedentes bacterium]|nr:hypothetical protein [Candidatus Hydrogenedentota bacterium]